MHPTTEKPSQQQQATSHVRSSKVHECQTTRQNQATFRVRSVAGQADQCFYLEFCPDFAQEQYFRALEAKLGKATVYQLTKMERHILVGLSSLQLADRLIDEGLDIENATLRAFPLRKRAERLMLGNVPFFVEDADLVAALRPYGQVTSIIQKMMQLEDSCCADARREAFITLRDGIKLSQIHSRLDVKSKGVITHIYVTNGIKCSLCLKHGHKRANCPPGQVDQCVYLEFCPDFTQEEYFRALETKMGKGTIYQLTKMEGHILVGLSSVQLADKLIEERLNIEDVTINASPFRKKAERFVLGNVLFLVEDAELVTALRPYEQVTSIIQMMMQLEDSC
ncbi:hypothetical protein LAZ67_19001776 [Cordylochernes scorpioides]|uniref:Uncharacterized protein n=1 Tax=Cordylochernes scorpioides TaxID=51811 RepID=A0ABY6LLT5_9ARAC|nr:hypothetical protein LAZ67_19001776 [Cordylochernes scorpioides]